MRTVVQVLREKSLVRAQTKEMPEEVRQALLRPFDEELKAIVEFQARQQSLALPQKR